MKKKLSSYSSILTRNLIILSKRVYKILISRRNLRMLDKEHAQKRKLFTEKFWKTLEEYGNII